MRLKYSMNLSTITLITKQMTHPLSSNDFRKFSFNSSFRLSQSPPEALYYFLNSCSQSPLPFPINSPSSILSLSFQYCQEGTTQSTGNQNNRVNANCGQRRCRRNSEESGRREERDRGMDEAKLSSVAIRIPLKTAP